MIELWQIQIINESAIEDVRKKVLVLSRDLSFDSDIASKLALITSEFSRTIFKSGKHSRLSICLDKNESSSKLAFIFRGVKGTYNVEPLRAFFDDVKTYNTEIGLHIVEFYKLLPNPDFNPESTFIKDAKERLSRLTKEQLMSALRQEITRRKKSEEDTIKVNKELEETAAQLADANSKLEKLANIDPLTNMLNRRGLQYSLNHVLQWYKREHEDFLVVLVDLDEFKKINDTFGHAVGDIVIKEVSRNLTNSLRSTDYVARIGGDEFMILLPKTQISEGIKVAEKIRLSIAGTPIIVSKDRDLKVTASVGVVPVTQDTPSIDELLSNTHQVIKRSKQGGRNRVSYEASGQVSGDSNDNDRERIKKKFMEGNDLYCVKQSIVNVNNSKVVGYELLSRSKTEGFEMPNDFFRICYEENILTLVDHKCLRNCIKETKALSGGIRYHINILPSTLIDIPVEHILKEFGTLDGNKTYCVEISEQHIIGNPSYLMESVCMLKDSGITVAIDDVGFGHSSLESLIVLDPDVIKIDRSTIHGVSEDPPRQRSLKRLLDMVRGLGDKFIVAEGVEIEEDLDFLKDVGIKYVQGYLFGKPF